MSPTEIALAFVAAINSGSIEHLACLMTDEHRFIDGDGSVHAGKDSMKAGWKEHLALIPDLHISISNTFEDGDTVVLIGWSSGTIVQDSELRPENAWRVPSAWRVVVESERVAVWQLYANQCALHRIYDRIRTV